MEGIGKIVGMIAGWRKGQVLYVGTKLGVFDLFDERKKLKSKDITLKLGLDEEFGFRFLRCLCVLGFLEDHGDRFFSITESGTLLRKDAKIPLWAMVSHQRADDMMIPYLSENFIRMLKSGSKPSYDLVNNRTCWDYFEENKNGCSDHFNLAMKVGSILQSKSLKHSFSQLSDIFLPEKISEKVKFCDIGGGVGELMKIVLQHFGEKECNIHDKIQGTVMDLARVFENKEKLYDPSNITYFPGNFFDSKKGIPSDQDIYAMKYILHDWNDEKSFEILSNIYNVAKTGSRVLICERIVPEKVDSINGNPCWLDIHMMTCVGGKERTISEWEILFDKSGWVLEKVAKGNSPQGDGIVVGIKK